MYAGDDGSRYSKSSSDKQLSVKECFEILELYSDWNTSQQSIQHAFGGVRTEEDDMLDARRALLTKVYKRLENLV